MTAFPDRRRKVGLALVGVVAAVALLGPLFAPHDPTDFVALPFERPSADAWLGTDFLGQDVLSRLLWGGRSILWMAVAATAIGAVLGIAGGAIAASSRKWLDDLLMGAADVVLAFPQLVLALLFVSILGPKLWLIVVVVGVSHVPRVARLTRSLTLELSGTPFVEAAHTLGLPRARIFMREVLPNIADALRVEIGVRLAWSVTFIASLSFLGLAVQRPDADWGRMINENRDALTTQPWAVLLPTAFVAAFIVGTNLASAGSGRRSTGSGAP